MTFDDRLKFPCWLYTEEDIEEERLTVSQMSQSMNDRRCSNEEVDESPSWKTQKS